MLCPYGNNPGTKMLVKRPSVERGWVQCWCGGNVTLSPVLTPINWCGQVQPMPNDNDCAWVTLPAHERGTGRLGGFDAALARRGFGSSGR